MGGQESAAFAIGAVSATLLAGQLVAILFRRLRHLLYASRGLIVGRVLTPQSRRIEIRDEMVLHDAVAVEKKRAQVWPRISLPIALSRPQLALARLLTGAIPFIIGIAIFIIFREDQATALFASCSVYGALTVAAFQWIFPALFEER